MSSTQVLGSFHEFLIVLVHTILYVRKLYPERSFELVRQYGIAVHQNRHPELYEWIESLATNCIHMIKAGKINKISIVIMYASTPLERFVIDLGSFSLDNLEQIDDADDTADEQLWKTLGEQYRACLVKLINMSDEFGSLPENCTFTILLESENPPPTDENTLSTWIVANGHKFKQDPNTLEKTSRLRLRPVQNVSTEPFSFSIWFEEDKMKTKMKA